VTEKKASPHAQIRRQIKKRGLLPAVGQKEKRKDWKRGMQKKTPKGGEKGGG